MKKRGEDHIYNWARLGGNLLQDKKKKIVMYVMYVIPHINNMILDFFWKSPVYISRKWSTLQLWRYSSGEAIWTWLKPFSRVSMCRM